MHVAIRELRNDTSAVLAALEAAEEITLTNRGTPVGRIVPIAFNMADWLITVEQDAPGSSDTGWLDEVLIDRKQEYDDRDVWS